MKRCYIVGAAPGAIAPFEREGALVIAADGGYDKLCAAGIIPDYIVGDFDSVAVALPQQIKTLRLPCEKDQTDMAAAAELALEQGCEQLYLLCALGGRTAHSVANLQLLHELTARGVRAEIVGEGERLRVLINGSMRFAAHSRGYISVFSLVERACGVCERGLKYRLDDYTLTNRDPVGVSNEFVGESAEISVREGALLIIYTPSAAEL